MSTSTTSSSLHREAELLGQTVVVIGGSAGIGLETARRARAEGANVILTGRDPERLQGGAQELGASTTAAFDATDPAGLEQFFRDLPIEIDHAMVSAGAPHHGRLIDMDAAQARADLSERACSVSAGRAQRCPQGKTRRHAAVHGRHRCPAPGRWPRHLLHGQCRAPRPHGKSGTRARAGSSQPHRRRLRRHAAVRIPARRTARRAPQSVAGDASNPPCHRTGRRGGARLTHHDQ